MIHFLYHVKGRERINEDKKYVKFCKKFAKECKRNGEYELGAEYERKVLNIEHSVEKMLPLYWKNGFTNNLHQSK